MIKSFLFDQSEMAKRINTFDWSKTPVGTLESWPQSLRNQVETLLANLFPTILLWGADLTVCAYNDAYRPILAKKPEALGRPFLEVWREVEGIIKPQLDRALQGKACYFRDALFTLDRLGELDQAYFDYCFSPIRDENGIIKGVLNTAVEMTDRKKAYMALRDSENRFRNLYEKAPLGYQSLDREGRYLGVNQAWLDMMGYSKAEVIGRLFSDFLEPEEIELYENRFPEFCATGVAHVDVRMVRSDGSSIVVHIDGAVSYDEEGQFKQTHCILHDVGELRRTEKLLKAEKLKLQEYFENLPMLAYNVSFDGIIKDVNNVAVRALGYTEKTELIGKALVPTIYAPASQDKAKKLIKKWKEVKVIKNEELQVVTKKGETIDVLLNVDTIFDHNGMPMHSLSTHLEITDRKKVEAGLAASEKKWRNILVNTPQIGISLDPKGKIVFVNKHFLKLTGWQQEEVIGLDWFDMFIPEPVREEIRGVFRTIFEKKDASDFTGYENEILTRNGELRTIAWSNVLTKDASGEIIGCNLPGHRRQRASAV